MRKLGDLKVSSAKLVVAGPLRLGDNGYTHEATAHRGQVSMSITGSEFDALDAAGAEDELPDFSDRCPEGRWRRTSGERGAMRDLRLT